MSTNVGVDAFPKPHRADVFPVLPALIPTMFPSLILSAVFLVALLLPLANTKPPVAARFARPQDIRAIWLLRDSTTTCPQNITHRAWITTNQTTFIVRHQFISQDNKSCISPSPEHSLAFHPRDAFDGDLQPVDPASGPQLPEETLRQLRGDTVAKRALEAGDRAGENYMLGYEIRVRQCGGVASFEDGTVVFVFRPFNDKLRMEGVDERLRRGFKWMVVAPREGGLCVYSSDINGPDDGDPDGGGMECFPGNAQVLTKTRGLVRIADVAVGEYVASGGDDWTKVIGFSHRDEVVEANMVQVRTSSGERTTASEGHFFYTTRGLATAGSLKAGDLLRIANGTMSRVSKVRKVTGTGLFNIQTMSGDVVVDGIWASTYTTAVRKEVAHAALAPLRFLTRLAECDFVFAAVEGAGLRRLAAMKQISSSLTL